jgi:transposase
MPDSHRRYGDWSPARLIRWAETIGTETAATVREVLERRPHPEQGFRSCLGILRLATRYSSERLENACRRARRIGSPSYRSVESILKNGLDRVAADHQQPQPTGPSLHHEHENIRGAEYYQPKEESIG